MTRRTPRPSAAVATSILLACCGPIAAAPSGPELRAYVTGALGVGVVTEAQFTDSWNTYEGTFDPDLMIGIQGGVDGGRWRIDGQLRSYSTRFDEFGRAGDLFATDGDIEISTMMLNGWYDFENSSGATPYLGGGLGWANVTVSDITNTRTSPAGSDSVGAFHVGGGVTANCTSRFALDIGLEYLATTQASLDTMRMTLRIAILQLGFRWSF